MFRIDFDTSEIESYGAKLSEAGKIDSDIQKHIQWYINQVYRDLSKQMGRSYSYITPPVSSRTVLRKRSGDLIEELRQAKYALFSDGEAEAGFNIRDGSILAVHEGSETTEPVVIRAHGDYMTIPLRAALNANGTPKTLSPRSFGAMRKFLIVDHLNKDTQSIKSGSRIIPVERSQVDAPGENVNKLHLVLGKWVGRKVVPYYLLAREVVILKRLFIQDALDKREQDLYDRLNASIEKLL